jgi:hypothetical protein
MLDFRVSCDQFRVDANRGGHFLPAAITNQANFLEAHFWMTSCCRPFESHLLLAPNQNAPRGRPACTAEEVVSNYLNSIKSD